MTDPFQKAKDIRAGKLDAELPDYEEITGWIHRVPSTWIPGILIEVIQSALYRKVFAEGGLVKIVQSIEKKYNTPGHGVLRGIDPDTEAETNETRKQ